jgi:hypothetical protein
MIRYINNLSKLSTRSDSLNLLTLYISLSRYSQYTSSNSTNPNRLSSSNLLQFIHFSLFSLPFLSRFLPNRLTAVSNSRYKISSSTLGQTPPSTMFSRQIVFTPICFELVHKFDLFNRCSSIPPHCESRGKTMWKTRGRISICRCYGMVKRLKGFEKNAWWSMDNSGSFASLREMVGWNFSGFGAEKCS